MYQLIRRPSQRRDNPPVLAQHTIPPSPPALPFISIFIRPSPPYHSIIYHLEIRHTSTERDKDQRTGRDRNTTSIDIISNEMETLPFGLAILYDP